jgi:transcriptional regulator
VPEILSPDENLRVLDRLVEHFERRVSEPRMLWERPNDATFVERLERGTVGFRMTPTKVVAKRKLSQNKTPDVVETIIAELSGDGSYAQPELAAEMRRAADARPQR